ncbi:hypothetical protein AB835_06825 [Candidatus Endobugula sertula]|uniref:Methyltransferase type 11 domain-containing protein n=1 Tax=Candidatus Endobugula sertula TaxID=62101 RepID=A0A1D2QQJ4_9GAMM|nr:hypothetical protein AB835_06825 [Candidatus Endobugula sertula]
MSKFWGEYVQQFYAKKSHALFGVKPIVKAQKNIESWFESDVGQRILRQEKTFLDVLLQEFFGYHLMQISVLSDECLYEASPISHCFSLNPQMPNNDNGDKKSVLVTAFEELPIDNDAIDVCLLHHVLDYSENPQQLLREVTRVTMPNGYIVIVGFNPFSSMGLLRPLACLLSRSEHWHYRQLRVGRLMVWFQVLGLDMLHCHHGYYGLPMKKHYSDYVEKVGRRILSSFGSFYILVVRKTMTPMTMMKLPWKGKYMIPPWSKGVVASSVTGSSRLTNKKSSNI